MQQRGQENENPSITDTDNGVEWVNAQGVKEKASTAFRDLHLRATDLRKSVGTNYIQENENPFDRQMVAIVIGKARLRDSGIQVIGSPETRSDMVSLSFREAPDTLERERGDGHKVRQVSIWHNEGNWEIGDDGGWLVDVYLGRKQMEALLSAIDQGSMTGLTLKIDAPDLLVDHPYAPAALKVEWYMRPKSIITRAELSSIELKFPALQFGPLSIIDTPDGDDAEVSINRAGNRSASAGYGVPDAIEKLTTSLRKLTTYVGWVAIFSMVAAISAFR